MDNKSSLKIFFLYTEGDNIIMFICNVLYCIRICFALDACHGCHMSFVNNYMQVLKKDTREDWTMSNCASLLNKVINIIFLS